MIKINISNEEDFLSQYCNQIILPLRFRIQYTIDALTYLVEDRSSLENNESNIVSISALVKDVIKIIKSNFSFNELKFHKENFLEDIRNVKEIIDFSQLKLTEIIELLSYLLEGDTLENLLKAPASELKQKNDDLLMMFNLDIENSKPLIKLAFNYEKHNTDISNHIRTYFKNKNIVITCPYCNMNKIKFLEDEHGIANTFQLDHFFDKGTHPLLCYSIFNLIPSDSICNSTNKKSIHFSDEYHLNPYDAGFNDDIKFEAIIRGNKQYNIRITTKINSSNPLYKKAFGDGIDQEKGNINVFKLKTKYQDETDIADMVIRETEAYNKQVRRKVLNYFRSKIVQSEITKKWYEDRFNYAFDENKYHTKAHSKFAKDIFFQYYKE